jgi:hypothetical protein
MNLLLSYYGLWSKVRKVCCAMNCFCLETGLWSCWSLQAVINMCSLPLSTTWSSYKIVWTFWRFCFKQYDEGTDDAIWSSKEKPFLLSWRFCSVLCGYFKTLKDPVVFMKESTFVLRQLFYLNMWHSCVLSFKTLWCTIDQAEKITSTKNVRFPTPYFFRDLSYP